MRLHELINGKVTTYLRHPSLGNVVWDEARFPAKSEYAGGRLGYWALMFAEGHEKWCVLEADESVLLDDEWEKVTY